jgi:uncharacterized lipoprotein YajG
VVTASSKDARMKTLGWLAAAAMLALCAQVRALLNSPIKKEGHYEML